MNGANWVIKFLKIQQQPGYYVICVENFHFGTLICITINIFLCNTVRSDQGGSRNLFSMIKINYLMLLLFLTIRDNSVHPKVQNIKSTMLSQTFAQIRSLSYQIFGI